MKITLSLGRFDIPYGNTLNLKELQHFGKCVSLLSCWVKRLKCFIFGQFLGQAQTSWSLSWLVAWQPHYNCTPTKK